MQLPCNGGHTFGLSIIFLHFSLFRFDHIAYAPDGLDHFDLENLIDLGPEKTDIYVYNIGFAYIIISANTLQENIPYSASGAVPLLKFLCCFMATRILASNSSIANGLVM